MLNGKTQELDRRRLAACPRGVAVQTHHYASRAENAEIWDVEGRRLIDFASGIAVLGTGHRHPRVVAAVKDQLDLLHHTCFHVTPYESYIELCEMLNEATPGDFPKKTALFTTGAEAVENAVKVARSATGRNAIVAFSGAFHGRTLMGMALTGKVSPYKKGFGAMPADVWHVPYPAPTLGVTTEDSIAALERLFKVDVDPTRVAAIFIEVVQGEGGFYVCPPALLEHLRALCDQHGIMLVADEVQTGFGRTGKLFALEHYGIAADLVTTAKSLAGGFPLSALTGRAAIMDAAEPGGLGGTYAGNPLSTAAALEVLKVIRDERLMDRAVELGERLQECLRELRSEVTEIADIRGLGAMVAVEFQNPTTKDPNPELLKRILKDALQQGLLLLSCGVHGNVIRFLFPLTIGDTLFKEGLTILRQVIRSNCTVA